MVARVAFRTDVPCQAKAAAVWKWVVRRPFLCVTDSRGCRSPGSMRGPSALFSAAENAMARRGPAVSAAGIGGRPTRVALPCPDGEVLDGGRSSRHTNVRACRLGRPGDLVVVPVQDLDPADLCDLPAALDGLVRRTWPEPAAGRADVERWLRTVAASGLSRASTAGHYDAVASIYRQAFDENPIAINPCARIARPKVLRELQHREVLEYAAFLTAARALGPTHHAMSDSFSSQVSELRRTLQGAIIQLEATGSGRKLREQTRVALVAKAIERIGDLLYWLHRRALERERLSGSHQDPDPSPALKDLLDEIRESGTG
jgi:hypothetical protein